MECLHRSEGSFDDESVQGAYLGVQGACTCKPATIFSCQVEHCIENEVITFAHTSIIGSFSPRFIASSYMSMIEVSGRSNQRPESNNVRNFELTIWM